MLDKEYAKYQADTRLALGQHWVGPVLAYWKEILELYCINLFEKLPTQFCSESGAEIPVKLTYTLIIDITIYPFTTML